MFKESFKTDFFTIEETIQNYDANGPYYRIKTPDTVIVCILTQKNNLLLIEQFRPNLNRKTKEFVAGYVDPNETPLEAAKRETFEEAGLDVKLIPIGKSKLLLNRFVNDDFLFLGLVDEQKIKKDFNVIIYNREDFIEDILKNNFEQLAGLGLISIINLKFKVNFLADKNIYNKLLDIYDSKKNSA